MSQTSPESLANLLLSRDPLPPLEPGKTIYSEKVKQDIVALHCDPVIKASLHLANDDLDACHDIVEPLSHDSDASVLHAILHRREGDYWNSNWWWRQCVPHGIFTAQDFGQAKLFVKECQEASQSGTNVKEVQKRQWEQLDRVVRYLLKERGN